MDAQPSVLGDGYRYALKQELFMNTLRLFFSLAGLAIAFSSGECADPPVAVAQLKVDARMSGAWEVSPELNSLLGFEDDDVRSDLVDHPLSFNLTIDQTLTESLTKEAKATFAQFCDEIYRPMGHQVIATGQWQTKFRVEPGISTACYITQSRGKTHIWVKAPFVILYGGQVSFINGAIAKRDALVLNFNPERKERTPNIAAYRRSAK